MASAPGEAVKSKAKKIDSHLHVWASPDEVKEILSILNKEVLDSHIM